MMKISISHKVFTQNVVKCTYNETRTADQFPIFFSEIQNFFKVNSPKFRCRRRNFNAFLIITN